MIDCFDHITIAVHEIDSAVTTYTRLLGAPPVWCGAHPEHGSHAALFGLENALVELVAPDAQADEALGLRAHLDARGEGLSALALGTSDAAALSGALRARGLRATPPQHGEARDMSGGVREYRTVELSARTTRGLSVFAVERTERLPAVAAPPPASAHALDHVVIRTSAPDAAIALYGTGLGVRLALDREVAGARMLFFRVGGVTLEVVHDPKLGEHDQLWGAAYRVCDIEAAHARLAAEGCTLGEIKRGQKPGTRVFTVRDGTCEVPTLILRDPARE